MSGEKLTRRALGLLDAVHAPKPELPERATGVIVYGTGLPKEGVHVSREEIEAGVVAVNSGPPSSGLRAINGRSLI